MLFNGSRLFIYSKKNSFKGPFCPFHSFKYISDNAVPINYIPTYLSPSGRIFSKMLSSEEKFKLLSETNKILFGAITFSSQIEVIKFIKDYNLVDDPKALEMILSLYNYLKCIPSEERINLAGTYFYFHVCRSFILNLPRGLILPAFVMIVEILRVLSTEINLSPEDVSSLFKSQRPSFSTFNSAFTSQNIIQMFNLNQKQAGLFTKLGQVLADTYSATGSLLEFYSISLLFQRVALYYDLKKIDLKSHFGWMHSASTVASCVSYGTRLGSTSFHTIPTLLDAIGLMQQVVPISSSPENPLFKAATKPANDLLGIYGLTQQNLIILYNSAFLQFLKSDSFSQGHALFEFIKGNVTDFRLDEKDLSSGTAPCKPNVETFKLIFSIYINEGVKSGNIKDAIIVLYAGLEYLLYPLDFCIHAAKILFATRALEDVKALYLRVKSSAIEVSQHIQFENTYLACLSTFQAVRNDERQTIRDISTLVLSHTGKSVIHSSNSSLLVGLLYRFKRRDLGIYINHLPVTFLSDCPIFFSYLIKLIIIDASHRSMLLSLINERFKIFDSYPEGSSLVDYRSGYISSLFSRNHPELAALIYYWEVFDFSNPIQDAHSHRFGISFSVKPSKKRPLQPALKPFSHYYMIRILYIEGNSTGIVKYFLYFLKRNLLENTVSYSWISNRTIDMLVWALSMEHEWVYLCNLLTYFSNSEDGGFTWDHLAMSGRTLPASGGVFAGGSRGQNYPASDTKIFVPPPFIESKYSLTIPQLYRELKPLIEAYPGNSSSISFLYSINTIICPATHLSCLEMAIMKSFLNNYNSVKEVRACVLSDKNNFLELNKNVKMYLKSILEIPVIFLDFYEKMLSHHKSLYSYLFN